MTNPTKRLKSRFEVVHVLGMLVLALTAAVATSVTLTDSGLWLDELTSVYASRPEFGIGKLFAERWVSDVHPPLYYLLLRGWTGLFGIGESALRSLSLVAYWSLLAIGVFASRRVLAREKALGFAMLLACSPAARHYAREVRMYEFLVLGGVLLAIELTRARLEIVENKSLSQRRVVALAAVAIATSYLHIWGMLMAGGVFLALLLTSWRAAAARIPIVLGGAAVVLGYVPWLAIHLAHRDDLAGGQFLAWRPPWETLKWVGQWMFGRGPFGIVALLLGVVLLFLAWRRERETAEGPVVPTLLLAPALAWLLATLISFSVPVFKHYVIVGLAPFVYFALARGTAFLPSSLSQLALPAIGCALLLSAPLGPKSREEWRESADYVRERCPDGGAIFVYPTNRELHHSRYYLRGERYELYPVRKRGDPQPLPRVGSDGCDVVLWAAHLSRERLDEIIGGLDLEEVDIREFRRAFVVSAPN